MLVSTEFMRGFWASFDKKYKRLFWAMRGIIPLKTPVTPHFHQIIRIFSLCKIFTQKKIRSIH
jgi:hypothetical protein